MKAANTKSISLRKLSFVATGMQSRSDHEVRRQLERLVTKERELTCEILLHLVEADRRKIHLKGGYSSLFDYCTRGLGYSESAAGRRIRAARALRDYPRVLAMLCVGELSICSLSAVAGILTRENHIGLLLDIRGKSRKQLEEILARCRPGRRIRERIRPVALRPEVSTALRDSDVESNLFHVKSKKRPVSDRRCGGRGFTTPGRDGMLHVPDCPADKKVKPGERMVDGRTPAEQPTSAPPSHSAEQIFKLEFTADKDFLARMEKVRSLLSCRFPRGMTMEKLFGILMDEYIERHSPEKRSERRAKRDGKRASKGRKNGSNGKDAEAGSFAQAPSAGEGRTENRGRNEISSKLPGGKCARRSRHIPARIRDEVHLRDGGRCTWVGPDGTRCGSTWDLEIDHVRPFARGGEHEVDNLRLLCGAHNRLAAAMVFGPWGA